MCQLKTYHGIVTRLDRGSICASVQTSAFGRNKERRTTRRFVRSSRTDPGTEKCLLHGKIRDRRPRRPQTVDYCTQAQKTTQNCARQNSPTYYTRAFSETSYRTQGTNYSAFKFLWCELRKEREHSFRASSGMNPCRASVTRSSGEKDTNIAYSKNVGICVVGEKPVLRSKVYCDTCGETVGQALCVRTVRWGSHYQGCILQR